MAEPLLHLVKSLFPVNPRRYSKSFGKQAAVSVIFRFSPSMDKDASCSITDYIRSFRDSGSILELLFVKRAVSERDRWSGHVAFPGGKQEENETAVETAIRETYEEIGLDLKEGFECLGQLPARSTSKGKEKQAAFLVNPVVFLQTKKEPNILKLQIEEIVGGNWVPFHFFSKKDHEYSYVKIPWNHVVNFWPELFSWFATVFKISGIQFPGVILPKSPSSITSEEDPSLEYHLWGLTYWLLNDLLKSCSLPTMKLRWTTSSVIFDHVGFYFSNQVNAIRHPNHHHHHSSSYLYYYYHHYPSLVWFSFGILLFALQFFRPQQRSLL